MIDVYDVFGIVPPTLQGADRLAESLNAVVLVPDFFQGEPIPLSLFPPDTDEKKQIAQNFMMGKANPSKILPVLIQTATEAKEMFPSVKNWAALGLCWGGKVCPRTCVVIGCRGQGAM